MTWRRLMGFLDRLSTFAPLFRANTVDTLRKLLYNIPSLRQPQNGLSAIEIREAKRDNIRTAKQN